MDETVSSAMLIQSVMVRDVMLTTRLVQRPESVISLQPLRPKDCSPGLSDARKISNPLSLMELDLTDPCKIFLMNDADIRDAKSMTSESVAPYRQIELNPRCSREK